MLDGIANTPTHRYWLYRCWDVSKPLVLFCGLNPSSAAETNPERDSKKDDPTIRRETGFAKSWGYGGFWKGNLYALRSTDPKGLQHAPDPVGPLNDQALLAMAGRCSLHVAAWGSTFQRRLKRGGFTAYWRAHDATKLLTALWPLYGIGAMATLHCSQPPPHPLYLSSTLKPFVWRPRSGP